MSLAVLSVAYALAPVGPDAVGGAEQVLSAIDRALAAAGHQSVVVGCAGSVAAGRLVETGVIPGIIDDAARAAAVAATRDAVRRSMDGVDLIHLHGLDFAEVLPQDGPPALVTLHLPTDWYPSLEVGRERTFLHGVSAAQTRACPVRLMAPIANGVDVGRLAGAVHARRRFALVLGRVCPEKGQHLAIEAARRAEIGLAVAGAVFGYGEHRAYFERQVKPRLDGRRRFLGPVGFGRKRRLLSSARCLLVPSSAEETSSLVAMEAAACGTPVVAFRRGALPEVVEEGVTGLLVDDVEEMAAAIGRAGEIEAEACREVARARFSAERMTARYLERYREIL